MHDCPHCQQPLFRKSANGSKAKLSRTAVVLHNNSSEVEINCPSCRRGVVLGSLSEVKLRKADPPSLIVRKT